MRDPAAVRPEAVHEAARRLASVASRTPILASRTLDIAAGRPVQLKAEIFQRGGSFKLRGAYNKIASLPEADRRRGVITYSSGNHGQGVAIAARIFGIPGVVVVPEDASRFKCDATRGYGARVVAAGRSVEDRKSRAEEIARAEGLVMIPPFDDADVVAGQGTVGLEIAEQCPAATAVLAPVGGSGLLAGIAVALSAERPGVRVIGVEPETAPKLSAALEKGEPVDTPLSSTIADGLRARRPGRIPFLSLRDRVRSVIRVTDAETAEAVRFLLFRLKVLVEPSGAVTVAAILFHRAELDESAGDSRSPVVAVLSGGNVDPETLRDLLSVSGPPI